MRFRAMCINGTDGQGIANEREEYYMSVIATAVADRNSYRSSSHPYAFGVSLMTVCSGILMYGRSACGRSWKYA